jgi:CO/xanthine dehydrogenase Mo-binding subunit
VAERTDAAARTFIRTEVEVEGRRETRIVEKPAFDVTPWDADAPLTAVGARRPRVDAAEKLAGRARYTADVTLPGMRHAVLVRAPWPRGRVAGLAADAARAVPGVVGVFGWDDLAADREAGRLAGAGAKLFTPDVRYAGQPVGVVVADTLDAARRAAALVAVTGEALPFAATAEQALADDAPPVRGRGANVSPGSPRELARGDVDAALADAPVTVRLTVRTPAALHSPLEPHGAVARWDGDQLTIWEGTQGIFRVRDDVARAFALPQADVRVVMDHMGGGFGAKNYAGTHTLVAAWAARHLGAPVRCLLDRAGVQTDTGHRPPTEQHVTLAAERDGTLHAIALEATVTLGERGWEGGPARIYHELYRCPNVRTRETFVFANTSQMRAFRGPGYAEGAVGLEIAMDELARVLGMDRIALRLANVPARDQAQDRPYTGHQLAECIETAWRRLPAARGNPPHGNAPRETTDVPAGARYRRGRGLAAQIWSTGGGPPAYAWVRLHKDGSVHVLAGTQDLGTGSKTILAQVAADALGADVGSVRCVAGDTERTPYTGNSWGSMTTPSVAPAVRMAAEDARRQLLEAAAGVLDADPAALTVAASVVTDPATGRALSFADLGRALGEVMIMGRGSRGPNPEGRAIVTVGAHAAEVEVDTWTGAVRVLRLVAVHDAGRIVNPLLAESQMQGGMQQGLGWALFEERVLDPAVGVVLNAGLHEYKIPTAADCPPFEVHFLPGADPEANTVGARGIAEPAIIPTAPAIANAVADALGAPVHALPITPARVHAALAGRDAAS